ncbi:CHAT domain-containing protein [Limnoraphis robusta]
MRLPQQWLSILSVNSIFLLNLGFPLLTLPPTLHRGEVIAQTDPNAEAERLFNQGLELFQQGTAESKKQAIIVWEKALQLYQQAGNLQRQAITLNNIGKLYSDLGDKQQALSFYNQSLPLSRQVGDKAGEAATLNNLGRVYSDLGDKQTALDFYNQSLPLSRQVGDKAGEAITLNNIGRVYSDLGDKQQALSFYNQSLPLRRQVGDKAGEANTLTNIGKLYSDLGDKQKALDYYNQSLSLWRQLGDKNREVIVLALIRDLGKNNSTDPNAEAERLLKQGLELFQQRTAESLKQAIAVSEKALKLYQEAGNLERQALSLSLLGRIYSDLGDKQQALEYYNQSLPLSRQVGDKAQEATILNNIGRVYSDLGDKQTALEYYNQSLALERQVGNKAGEATTLNNIGFVYSDLGDKQTALDYLNQSLPLFRQVGDKAGEATTLNNIGLVYSDLGDKQQALDFYNQSLPLSRQVGDKAGEARTLTGIGAVYSDLGDKQQALEFYNQSLPLRRQVGDKAGEATTLNNIGFVYSDLGDKQQALSYYNQSLPLFRQVGDKAGEAATLNNIGRVYSDLGDFQTALDFYNQSLPLFRQVGDKAGEATTLNNIGLVYNALGDKQQALDFYNQSLPLMRQVGNKAGEAATLASIGNVYNALGDFQTALDFYNQSLPLWQQVGNKAGEAITLNNIGVVYDALGDQQTALDYYNQSLPLSRQVGDKAQEATTLNNIGSIYYALGDKQQALDFYNQSLLLKRQVGDKAQEATTLNNIGMVYSDLGDKQTALDYLNQSLPLSRQVGDKAQEATTLSNFAFLKRSQGNLTEALTDMELAINIIEELRTKIISQDLRTSYFASVFSYYQFYIDLLMELHQQNPNQGYDAKALNASERGRARSLLDILAESGADIKKGVDPQLLAEEKRLLQRLNALDQTRQLNPGERDFEELKQEIEAVRGELRNLEVEIKRNSPQYANLQYPEPLTASEIQQQVLDDETVLLVYSLGTERSFLWFVSTTEVKSYQLPKRSDIEALATSFLEEIQSLAVVPPSGEKLSEMLLSPVINQLGNKRLVIVGDGILQTVPFAALPISSPVSRPLNPSAPKPPIMGAFIDGGLVKMGDLEKINSPQTWGARGAKLTSLEGEGSQKRDNSSLLSGGIEGGQNRNSSLLSGGTEGGNSTSLPTPFSPPFLRGEGGIKVSQNRGYKPLIVQHEIITLPSASSLAILREQVQGRTPAPKKVVVIADPVFEENDPRFQIASQPKTETNDVNTIVLRQSLEDFLGKSFGRLQHTRQEAEAILALVPDGLKRLALDFNANRNTATDSNLSQYQIVHFATHGLLNESQPELSGLVFSLYDEQGTEKAGFLQLSDIFNLTLSAELVVLSACQTGIGQDIRGEGLVSLTRGFMYAGAERVVVSLWAVADNSTSEFMQNYYRKILEAGSNPATAMREVQLEMIQSDNYNAPFYWAPFVFQGEWKTGLSTR